MADEQKKLTRDEMRASIFKDKVVAKETIEFFGTQIEMRQPRLSDIMAIKKVAEEEGGNQSAIVDTLVRYAYVPGTEEKLFEEGDAAQFLAMPFGPDLIRVSDALERLTQVNFRSGNESSIKT